MEPHPYRQAFADRNLDGLVALLADDVVFQSPDIAAPGFEGRGAVATLLAILLDVVTDVEYTHDLGDEGARILVNNGRVLSKPIKATTLLAFNATGRSARSG
jgi:hypothetical protein